MSTPAASPPSVESVMSGRTWSLLFALSLLWGCSFPLVKIAVAGVPPLTLVFARVLIGAAALTPVLYLAGEKLPRGKEIWIAFFGMALLNNVIPWSLSFWAQQTLPSALGAILNATTPLFSVVVCHFFLPDERMRANRLAGVVVGFVGVAILIGPSLLLQGERWLIAEIAFLGAALSYAFSGILGRRFARFGVSAVKSAHGQLTASAVMMAPLALIVERPWNGPAPTTTQLLAVLAIGLLTTALAYLLFFRILARAGATNVMLVTLLVPPSAFLVGWLFLGEHVEPRNLAGMAFIAAGLGLIDGRPIRWARARLFAPRAAQDARGAKVD